MSIYAGKFKFTFEFTWILSDHEIRKRVRVKKFNPLESLMSQRKAK